MWHKWDTGELRAAFGVEGDVKSCIEHRKTDGRITCEIGLFRRRTERDINTNVH